MPSDIFIKFSSIFSCFHHIGMILAAKTLLAVKCDQDENIYIVSATETHNCPVKFC